MKSPLVSIIIPTFNRVNLIADTLYSIINQTYKNWECIIVDDISTDKTLKVLKEFKNKDKRINYFQRPENMLKGANSCRNYGFEKSKGELINWFDSDDIMCKDFLLKAVNSFNTVKDLSFVLFDFATFKGSIDNIIGTQKNTTTNIIEDYATWKINFGTWAIVWSRNTVENYRFDVRLTRAQDLDFNLRILFNEKLNFIAIGEVGVYLRSHPDNLTSLYNNMNLSSLKSEIYVRKKLINKLKEINSEKKIIKESTDILLMSFVKLYRGKYYQVFFKEIIYFLNFKSIKSFVWYVEILMYFFFYIVFRRGDLRLKKAIYKIH